MAKKNIAGAAAVKDIAIRECMVTNKKLYELLSISALWALSTVIFALVVIIVVAMNVAGRKNLNKSVSELVQETFQGKVFSTHIRNAITLAEAPTQGQDIFHYAPKSAGAEDYEKVCNELLTEIK